MKKKSASRKSSGAKSTAGSSTLSMAIRKSVDTSLPESDDYRLFIEGLKQRVLSARISAARAVTHEAILLYWDIGRGIVEKQQSCG